MVMSMDISADQTMSSPPPNHSPNGESVSPIGNLTSPSPFQQQESADDDHDDEHSKGSNQTVVPKQQQQQHDTQIVLPLSHSSIEPQPEPMVQQQQQNVGSEMNIIDDEQMIVSRGSSFDGDKKLEMNVDAVDDSNDDDDESLRAGLKFNTSKIATNISQAKGVGQVVVLGDNKTTKIESSLVAQMRDIVEGGAGSMVGKQQPARVQSNDETANAQQHYDDDQRGQPKSSNDSLNNQNDNNTSKASLDSATASHQKRTRHSRAHCRHHHHHHNQHHQHHHHQHHRHRQSVGGASMTGIQQATDDNNNNTVEGQSNLSSDQQQQRHPHYHHHHRHSNAGHTHAHHHHHHHRHHPNPHHHHHHHHHHGHQHDKTTRGTTSKRNSIQTMNDHNESTASAIQSQKSVDQQQQAKNESNSSMSSTSLTKQQGQQSSHHHHHQCNQPESKSSETPSTDEQNLDQENQGLSGNSRVATGNHQPHHHHHHHHHCHHRSHKKRLVLDNNSSNNQRATVTKSDTKLNNESTGIQDEEVQASCRKPLQDSTSGMMNIETDRDKSHMMRYHHHHHHPGHHHHHHHHPHDHHSHHHHHPHHHHQHHCANQQSSSNKDLDDPNQQQQHSTTDGSHRHHRHHHHHHNHHHGHHNCRHTRQRNRQRSGSKPNLSPRDSDKNLGADKGVEQQATQVNDAPSERRFSTQKSRISNSRDQMNIDQLTHESKDDNKIERNDDGEEQEVKMEMSPTNDEKRRPSTLSVEMKRVLSHEHDSNKTTSTDPPVNTIVSGNINCVAKDSEITGGNADGATSRKHDSSCNFNEIHQSNQENLPSNEAGNNLENRNRLTRQMSSQSSKKSQKDTLQGSAGQDQQNQRLDECAEQNSQIISQALQSSKPKQIIESNVVPADRRCRLCWCCCCPCSALNVRETQDRNTEKTKALVVQSGSPTSKYPAPENVSLDEIRAWGESFDKLMKCTDGRKVFQDFLRCEYSEENILFWSACEELKKEKDLKSIAAKARDIYEDYISILSSKEVSLDSRVRDVINNNIKKPTSNIFDEAQLQIYTLMHRDSYPRFINSGMYKKLAQITTSNSRKSSS